MKNANLTNLAGNQSTGYTREQQDYNFLKALHHAIENDELCIDYQPRYDISTGKADTFEAFVRWNRKGVGKVYPATFIDSAIEHGLIFPLALWVFKKCCADLICLREDVDDDIRIAVNISPMECESLHHTQKLIEICNSYGLLLSDFEFEITEGSYIKDVRKVKAFCDTVIERGATISLGNFGTCFSPLEHLCELPISYIKIGHQFTNKIGYGGRSDVLVSHLIKLAHDMEIKVVAEGVEHACQRDHLASLGCDQIQGYHMCRPLDLSNINADHLTMKPV
jgi:EAL domain-containing protein (putative c-di-GMP-specific phosphodiesterase class I)